MGRGRTKCWRLLRKLEKGTGLVDLGVLELEPVHRTLSSASIHGEAARVTECEVVAGSAEQGYSVNCSRMGE